MAVVILRFRRLLGHCVVSAMMTVVSVWATPVHATDCTVPTMNMAESLFETFSSALKTQHPDRVTRLFADDGAFRGFASSVGRSGYMPIRDYFLYFLQFEPSARVSGRTVDTGCDFLVDQGTLTWSLKPRDGGANESRETRFRIVYERAESGWRISEFTDVLAGVSAAVAQFAVPPPGTGSGRVAVVDPASGTAVAGFVKRAETAPAAASRAVKTAPRKAVPMVETFGLESVPRDYN